MFKVKVAPLLLLSLLNFSHAEPLEVRASCENLFDGLLGNLDFLNFNIEIGSCSFGFNAGDSHCGDAMMDFKIEAQNILGKRNYSLSCDDFGDKTNDSDDRVVSAAFDGFTPYDRASHLSTDISTYYFSGGKTNDETKEILLNQVDKSAFFNERNQQQGYVFTLATQEEECKKESTVDSMQCAFVDSIGGYSDNREKYFEYLDDASNKRAATMEVSAMPDKSIVLPSQASKEMLPVELKETYRSVSMQEIYIDTLFRSNLGTFLHHRKSMYDLENESFSVTSIPTYDKLKHTIVTKRKDEKLP